jgi:hypothetical protein
MLDISERSFVRGWLAASFFNTLAVLAVWEIFHV